MTYAELIDSDIEKMMSSAGAYKISGDGFNTIISNKVYKYEVYTDEYPIYTDNLIGLLKYIVVNALDYSEFIVNGKIYCWDSDHIDCFLKDPVSTQGVAIPHDICGDGWGSGILVA